MSRVVESSGRKFWGWKEIANELRVCAKTAYRYSRRASPEHRLLVTYVAGRVMAWESWLDAFERNGVSVDERPRRNALHT